MDSDSELEKIRQNKKQQLKRQQNQNTDDSPEASEAKASQEEQRDKLVKQATTEDAWRRIQTVELAHEERAEAAKQAVLSIKQSGRVSGKVSEEIVKEILKKIADEDSESYNITRR